MGRNRHQARQMLKDNVITKSLFRLASIEFLCKVNRQLKILHLHRLATALTVRRSICFSFAAKSENKKCPVFFHTPIRNLSFHFVIRTKAKIKSHCWTGLASKKLTQNHCRPSSLPAHAFYQREHYTPNFLFVSRPVGCGVIISALFRFHWLCQETTHCNLGLRIHNLSRRVLQCNSPQRQNQLSKEW